MTKGTGTQRLDVTLHWPDSSQCPRGKGKSWTVHPNTSVWYKPSTAQDAMLPFNNTHYKPTVPTDYPHVNCPKREHALTAVYLRPRQIDDSVKTHIEFVLTTTLKLQMRPRSHGIAGPTPDLCDLRRCALQGGNYQVYHMPSISGNYQVYHMPRIME